MQLIKLTWSVISVVQKCQSSPAGLLEKPSLSCPVPRHLRLVSNNYLFQSDWIKKSLQTFCRHVHSLADAIPLVLKVPTVHTNCNPYPAKASSSLKPLCVFVFSSFEFTTPSLSSSRAYICLSFIFLSLCIILCHIRRRHLVSVSII